MSLKDPNWFYEKMPDDGTAFGLRIEATLLDEQTPYQHLQVFQTQGFGKFMVLDGCTMVTERDNFLYHEMMSHPALFSHPHPKNVVIIGGGDCGTLREVLKHDCVENAWQIEIDEAVTRAAEKFFPELCEANNDPRAHLQFEDGIAWINNAAPGSIDLIIVDSTDPVGPAEGLFQEPFYRACHKALGEHGLLIQQSESPLLHAQRVTWAMHDITRAAGFVDTKTLFFPQPIYPSGWWSATIAAKQTINFKRREAAEKKNFETVYYNAEIHTAAFAQPEFFKKRQAR
ncbi:MAG: polyamine aminopropyltransferase [Gammaproteobacteria bacterium]|nr:polyamine aminopropyltransferase [Gammaproteobacteria bacterium]